MPDRFSTRITYGHEYDRRLRVALVGCGGQAFRNLLPTFHYAPVDLVATCDVDADRAAAYARRHGAERSYGEYRTLLDREADRLDAVFLATGYDEAGMPLYPIQVPQALEAGLHVWMEKPPAAHAEQIEALREARDRAGRQVGVGFMKMFSPAARKVHEIIHAPEFGRPTTCYLRDPEMLPPREHRQNPRRMVYVLDHVVHSASLLHHLLGPLRRIYVEEGPGGEFDRKFEVRRRGLRRPAHVVGSVGPVPQGALRGRGAGGQRGCREQPADHLLPPRPAWQRAVRVRTHRRLYERERLRPLVLGDRLLLRSTVQHAHLLSGVRPGGPLLLPLPTRGSPGARRRA